MSIPWARSCRTDLSRYVPASHRRARYQSTPVQTTNQPIASRRSAELRTLWVTFGPFAASEDCAKKTKVIVRISRAEMAIL